MIKKHTHPYQRAAGFILLALAVPLLLWVWLPSRQISVQPMQFAFWHSAIETLAIVVSMLVFVTGYWAILSARKGVVILLGVAFFGVGLLDFLHTMSYVGMPDAITVNSSQKSIFFWLSARLLAASALLMYIALPVMATITLARKRLALVTMLIVVGLIGSIGLFWLDHVPALFIPGQGLTPLKVDLEWLIILINLATLVMLWHRRKKLVNECVMALAFAVLFSAISELFFTMLGGIDKDAANAIGHLYKVAAYLFLFHATFSEALRRPLERMEIQHLHEKLILSASPDGILWVDKNGNILMVNPAMNTLTGYSVNEMVGQNVDMFMPEHLRARHARSMRSYFLAPLPRAMGLMDLKLLRRDGQMLAVDISLGYWEGDGESHAIAYIRDLTERKKFEDSLLHQATHDGLTGLPNRTLLLDRLEQVITLSERNVHFAALLMIDLDNFKELNDTLGHDVGDLLLKQVANRLTLCVRDGDTVARLGGDEFVVIFANLNASEVDAASGTKTVAKKILDSLNQSYQFGDRKHNSTASIGATLFRGHTINIENLMKQADIAMYRAKEAGRNTIRFFDPTMETALLKRVAMEKDLRDAIVGRQFVLHYQAQVARKGQITGAEVLLRWQHPQLGMVSPMDFIPLAEETGLILPLGQWVLKTACMQLAIWASQPEKAELTLAVNVSSRQFRQPEFVAEVLGILKESGANPLLLKLELTESLLVDDMEEVIAKMLALKAVGVGFSLDDFGTGYSSLSYLKRLPLDQLKIDQSFIRDVLIDQNDAAIARTIIAFAYGLGLNVIAEGVETEDQRNFLTASGCHAYQGYFFSRPLPINAFEAFLLTRTENWSQNESFVH